MGRRFFGFDEDSVDQNKTESVTPTKAESNGPGTVNGEIYNAACVNVREEASKMSKIIEVLDAGTKVGILWKGSGFCKVSTPSGFTGYVVAMYVKEV